MKMLQRIFLAGIASALLLGSAASSARAGTIPVTNDFGLVGAFTAVNDGGGKITFTLSGPSSVIGINGSTSLPGLPLPAAFDPTITITESVSGTDVTISSTAPPLLSKMFTDPTGTADLTYQLKTTPSAISDPQNLSLNGVIVGTGSPTGTYDYSPLMGGRMALAFNGAFFTSPPGVSVTTVSQFLAPTAPGAKWIGVASFSESAIPEPASLALLGIGLSGLFMLRRFFRRTSVA